MDKKTYELYTDRFGKQRVIMPVSDVAHKFPKKITNNRNRDRWNFGYYMHELYIRNNWVHMHAEQSIYFDSIVYPKIMQRVKENLVENYEYEQPIILASFDLNLDKLYKIEYTDAFGIDIKNIKIEFDSETEYQQFLDEVLPFSSTDETGGSNIDVNKQYYSYVNPHRQMFSATVFNKYLDCLDHIESQL